MKKLVILLMPFCMSSCCNKQIYEKTILDLTTKIDSLNKEIISSQETIEILKDEIQFREGEISLYGHQLDSCKQGLKK